MLYKLWNAFIKEILLLWRDPGGIVIIFVMPLMLIITITLIQDSTFKNFEDTKIPIILVDNDKGEISKNVVQNIKDSKSFEIVNKNFDENAAKKSVFNGEFQLAIIIPKNISKDLNANINYKVENVVNSLSYAPESETTTSEPTIKSREINLYFDPATNQSFKSSVKNTIDKMIFKIENQKIYSAFQEQLGTESESIDQTNFITFKEITPNQKKEALPSSVQHNVPAWALFAIFLITIPLSINLVKEKGQGTMLRILSSPTPYFVHILGKTITYLFICLIQFLTMIAVGIYIFPLIGLTQFEIGNQLPLMLFLTIFAGLAAIGLGILIGTIAETQEQSAPFSATFVVILAAIGGIWVPVFMMPNFMQTISQFSPMNWGLSAYYDLILRNASLLEILPKCGLLFLFYLVTVFAALLFYRKKNEV